MKDRSKKSEYVMGILVVRCGDKHLLKILSILLTIYKYKQMILKENFETIFLKEFRPRR